MIIEALIVPKWNIHSQTQIGNQQLFITQKAVGTAMGDRQ
jgi:hypothetical protein